MIGGRRRAISGAKLFVLSPLNVQLTGVVVMMPQYLQLMMTKLPVDQM